MFTRINSRGPRPPHLLLWGVLMLCFTITLAESAPAYVDTAFRWTRSPLKNLLGQALPAAATYEVWVLQQGGTEYMAATVNDTTYTLRATPGVTYNLRVRGVSALGLKSLFSTQSEAYKAPAASPTPSVLLADFGPAYPNPFNASASIRYSVPEGLESTSPLGMEIFDVRGRRLRVVNLDRSPGSHEVHWDGRDDSGAVVPAGMYIAQFVCGPYQAHTKLTLLP